MWRVLPVEQKAVILGELFEALLGDEGGEGDGVLPRLLPQAGVHPPVEFDDIPFPRPPQISRQYLEKLQRLGDFGKHLIRLYMSHGTAPVG